MLEDAPGGPRRCDSPASGSPGRRATRTQFNTEAGPLSPSESTPHGALAEGSREWEARCSHRARGAAPAQGGAPVLAFTWTGAPVRIPTMDVVGHSFVISPTLTGQTWQGLSSTPGAFPQPTALRWGPESGPCVPRLLEVTATLRPLEKISTDLSPEVRRRLSESCRQPVTCPTGSPKPRFQQGLCPSCHLVPHAGRALSATDKVAFLVFWGTTSTHMGKPPPESSQPEGLEEWQLGAPCARHWRGGC